MKYPEQTRFPLHTIFFHLLLTANLSYAALNASVGTVGKELITQREVELLSKIEFFLTSSEKTLDPLVKNTSLGKPSKASKMGAEETSQALMERAVYLEATSFGITDTGEIDFKSTLQSLQKVSQSSPDWIKLEIRESELKSLLEKKLIAKNFIRIKSSSLAGIITNQEALQYYERNRSKFGDSSFPQFKDSIKSFLAQQQMEERLKSWFEVLKRKYRVKNFFISQIR